MAPSYVLRGHYQHSHSTYAPEAIQAAWKKAQVRAAHCAPKPPRRRAAARAALAIELTAPIVAEDETRLDDLVLMDDGFMRAGRGISLARPQGENQRMNSNTDQYEEEAEQLCDVVGMSPRLEAQTSLWDKAWLPPPTDSSPPPSPRRQMLDLIAEEELFYEHIYKRYLANLRILDGSKRPANFCYTYFAQFPWPVLTNKGITPTMVQDAHIVRFYSNGPFAGASIELLQEHCDRWEPNSWLAQNAGSVGSGILSEVRGGMGMVNRVLHGMIENVDQGYNSDAESSDSQSSDEI